LDSTCPNGHRYVVAFEAFYSKKHRCKRCRDDALRFSIEFVRSALGKEGYILLSDVYVNMKSKIRVRCPQGHEVGMSFGNWSSGYRCKYCARNVRFRLDEVRDFLQREDYTLLSDHYINQKQKLEYRCPDGHYYATTWSDWQSGCRCGICRVINMTGAKNREWKGGISFEPYCDVWKDKEYKESIKERDDYTCQNPICSGGFKNDLTVHHIDYNKRNCHPNNLITLCRSCNGRANKDRDWCVDRYRLILSKKYDYKY
jgi:ribosomal protein S27E